MLFFLSQSYAQEVVSPPDKQLSIKFSPQHLFVNGLHLYAEKLPEPGGRHGFVLSPRLYVGNSKTVDVLAGRNWEGEEESEVRGYGAEVQHKIYLNDYASPYDRRVYLAYGANYHHFNVEFEREGWVRETDPEGLEVYRHRMRPFHEKINRVGGVGLIGLQVPAAEGVLLFDFYVGAALKKSSISTDYSQVRYDRNAFDFGYSGLHFVSGITLGVAL
ncbi:hypothetical protein [Pontibacter kalidii]|uniref:hypothetical protein n=1 Tax=Pontibacter kalidii TaxID=2592049 RepID=UPI0022566759|nr:hypothetical protein [Pontibacter kalidii]